MKGRKVCMVFDDLALYRKAIYTSIDNQYDCDWYIGNSDTGVKTFDECELKKVKRISVFKLGPFYFVPQLICLLFKKFDIYFVLGETRNVSLVIFCLLKKIFYRSKRIYFWTHGFYGKETKWEILLWKGPLFRLPDGIFTYGNYAKKLMVEHGFDESKLFPIHNSLDYDTQLNLRNSLSVSPIYSNHFGNENPVIIFIGRLTPVKRLDLLINAVALLKEKRKCYNVVLVGDGSERTNLELIVSNHKIEKQVWFYGESYDEKQNAKLLFNADVCVAPGNIGLTAIHSLMFGCPAISHNNYSLQMPEFESIKPNVTGDFFLYNDYYNLAEVIDRWLTSHKVSRENVRKACYKEIDTFWTPYYQLEIIKKHLL